MWLTFLSQVGLLYDEVSLQNVVDMIADWTPEDIQKLRDMVMKNTTTRIYFVKRNEMHIETSGHPSTFL